MHVHTCGVSICSCCAVRWCAVTICQCHHYMLVTRTCQLIAPRSPGLRASSRAAVTANSKLLAPLVTNAAVGPPFVCTPVRKDQCAQQYRADSTAGAPPDNMSGALQIKQRGIIAGRAAARLIPILGAHRLSPCAPRPTLALRFWGETSGPLVVQLRCTRTLSEVRKRSQGPIDTALY